MWLVWCGALLLVLKWFEVDPVATWSWWWILAPLAVAFLWFEFFERMFGRDRRQVEMAELREARQTACGRYLRGFPQGARRPFLSRCIASVALPGKAACFACCEGILPAHG